MILVMVHINILTDTIYDIVCISNSVCNVDTYFYVYINLLTLSVNLRARVFMFIWLVN